MYDYSVCVVVAMYRYEAKLEDELTLMVGDIIRCVSKRKGSWLYGEIGDRRGLFPEHYVRRVERLDYHIKSRSKIYRVVFSYRPLRVDELELIPGQVVEVVGEDELGWWKGRSDNRLGVFPSNFVCGPIDSNDENSMLCISREMDRWLQCMTDQTKPFPQPRLFNHRPEVLGSPVVFSRHVPISANLFDPEDEPSLLFSSLDLVVQHYDKSISNTGSRMRQSRYNKRKTRGCHGTIRLSANSSKTALKRFFSCGTLFDDDKDHSYSPIMTKRRNTVSALMKNNIHSIKYFSKHKRRTEEPIRNSPSSTLMYKPESWMNPFNSTPIVEDQRYFRNSSFDSLGSRQNLTVGSCQATSAGSRFSLDFADSPSYERILIKSEDSGVGGCEDNDYSVEPGGPIDITDNVFNDEIKNSEPLLSADTEDTKAFPSKIRTSFSTSISAQLGQKRNSIPTNPSVFWNSTKHLWRGIL